MREEDLKIRVAVYGTLMRGEPNARLIPPGTERKAARLKGTLIDTGWGFPALFEEGDTEIAAEIVEVDAGTLRRLDTLEGVPVLYRRAAVDAILEDGRSIDVWAYVFAQEAPEGALPIKGGDWRAWRSEGPGRPS